MIKEQTYYQTLNYGSKGRGNPPGSYPDSSDWVKLMSFQRYRSYGVTPEFKNVVKQRKLDRKAGLIPQFNLLQMNEYYDQQTRVFHDPDSFFYNDGGGKVAMFGCLSVPSVTRFCQPGYLPFPEHIELANKCIKRLPSRMNGENFNLPVFLAEARKSVDMILSATTKINTVIKRVQERVNNRHGRRINGTYVPFVKGREAWQKDMDLSIGNMWLEYRYGWRLLCKDIYDAMKAIHSLYNSSLKQRVSCSAVETTSRTFVQSGLVNGGYTGYLAPQQWDVRVTENCTFTTKYTIYYKDNNPSLGTLQQFGISNPLLLAWELIPYSFVVDWFVPVGDFLQGLDAFLGKSFLAGTVSYTYDEKKTFMASNLRYPYWTEYGSFASDYIPGTSTIHHRAYQRNVLGSFPTQNLPFIDVNLNTSRCIDGIALLLQQKGSLVSAFKSRKTYAG